MRTEATDRSLSELVCGLTSQLKDLASDVHHAELMRAARRGNSADVASWGALCREAIDVRSAPHCNGAFTLCASPLWFAAYRSDLTSATALLERDADPNCCSYKCCGAQCPVGRLSALHVALSRNSPDCVQRLLYLGASTELQLCFAVDEDDEPCALTHMGSIRAPPR